MEKFVFEKSIPIQDGEYWWGGSVGQGIRMPIKQDSVYNHSCAEKCQGNSFNGIFSSNFGRYLVTEGVYEVTAANGVLTLRSSKEIVYGQAETQTLKGGYLAAAKLACKKDEVDVPPDLLLLPQFCTWTEMGVSVSQKKVEDYAQSIVDAGLAHSLFIIDDGWSKGYGDWDFNEEKFPDPKGMVQKLHALGFKVYLWLVPFVNADVPDYPLLCENNALVRGQDGKPTLKTWWNCDSYVLDMTSPFAKTWLKTKLDFYVNEYGVDGFKFDAGDTDYYNYDDITCAPITPSGQCLLWAEFAAEYQYSELRACFRLGGSHVITRLSDKQRNWSDECGIGTLVPNMIQAGLCCYPYSCADMIGGGIISDFEESDGKRKADTFDTELISRFCECSALMPCMQFSYAYWNRNDEIKALFLKYSSVRLEMETYLSALIQEAKTTFAPILRHVEYEFPHQGYKDCNDCFMLGEKYFVSPVTLEGQTEKTLRLPAGAKWQYAHDNRVFNGGETVCISCPVGTLPYFKKID